MPPVVWNGQAATPCGFGGHRGYIVEKIGESERVLPQKFETSSSGALIAATENSTKQVTVTVTNAGIAAVEQYDLRMP